MELNNLITDKDLETEGVWIEFDLVEGDARILIARQGNDKYHNRLQELLKPLKAKVRKNKMTDAEWEDVLTKAYSTTIILNWEGFTRNGKEFPYTPENAEQLLRESRDFFKWVSKQADDRENYLRKQTEQAEKNSGKPSATNASGATKKTGSKKPR